MCLKLYVFVVCSVKVFIRPEFIADSLVHVSTPFIGQGTVTAKTMPSSTSNRLVVPLPGLVDGTVAERPFSFQKVQNVDTIRVASLYPALYFLEGFHGNCPMFPITASLHHFKGSDTLKQCCPPNDRVCFGWMTAKHPQKIMSAKVEIVFHLFGN
jgi:hypothetical protein